MTSSLMLKGKLFEYVIDVASRLPGNQSCGFQNSSKAKLVVGFCVNLVNEYTTRTSKDIFALTVSAPETVFSHRMFETFLLHHLKEKISIIK